jgi:hypothetical protein
MRTSIKFAIPVLSLSVVLCFAGSAVAQANGFHGGGVAPRGVPASVTSFGFGGHPGFHGVPASVTSQKFGAHFGVHGTPGSVTSVGFGQSFHVHVRPFGPNHGRRVIYTPFYGAYYAYPYPYDMSGYDSYPQDDSAAYAEQDSRDYDDRQQLNDDYRTELNSARPQQLEAKAEPEPVSDQPDTVLIFKDGHQVEVANYAIVGSTLYELNDGRSKKVQLADLDLPATVKENDNRGVEFQLPAGMKLN